MSSRPARSCSILFAALLAARSVCGQAEVPTIFQFSLSNPGARSLGLGGAFVALADDATAAFANPAGLVQLARPEVSVEGRLWSYSTPFTEAGRISGQPTGVLLDVSPATRTGVSSELVTGLSFISFTYPKEDWSVAVYRHESANFEAAAETQGFFAAPPLPDDDIVTLSFQVDDTLRLPDLRRITDLEIVTYGFSGAFRPTESFSVGGGVSYFDGSLRSTVDIFAAVDETLPQGPFGGNAYREAARAFTADSTVDDSDWGFNGGFLWHLSDRWNVGGSYREGPRFDLSNLEISGPALEPFVPEGTVTLKSTTRIGFPDVFSLGVVYQPEGGATTVSFEWDRVQHSNLFEGEPESLELGLRLDDVNELHLGFEYVFINATPTVALRFGAWTDPDHRIRYVGDDPVLRALFPAGDDEVHFAVGFGMAFSKFQIDVGVDLSDLVNTTSFSAIYSF
ncbi:MAG TPA: outer membrane protein transport protein [Vicinamibacteria bacterium]|nr:outer membrane protein transport protein [Vicinamibacteria bacterium]